MMMMMMMGKIRIMLNKVGATTSGVFLVAYVLAMEMVGPQYRSTDHDHIDTFWHHTFFDTQRTFI